MIISPFTPLQFFRDRRDGIDGRYIQTFATTDRLLIELIGQAGLSAVSTVFTEPGHERMFDIAFSRWDINSDTTLLFGVITLPVGRYSIEIDGICSTQFNVTDDPLELAGTTLIQYSMDSNRHRQDGVFFIDGMQRFFDFRVPGGFREKDWTFGVDGEQFMTDSGDIVQLYGLEHTVKKFTLGNGVGCSVWFAEMLNRALCCSFVYFDGVRYARKDNAVPEMTVLVDGLNSFVFTQQVQKVANIDPVIAGKHELLTRRTSSGFSRIVREDSIRNLTR